MPEIYYIGGSPCSGKSSIAEMLVQKYGFRYFKLDDYLDEYMKRGATEGIALFDKVIRMPMEEVWMREPSEQCDEELLLYETMFAYAMESIRNLPKDKPIIAEGAGFLPRLIHKLGVDKAHYICIVPTKAFQLRTYAGREWIAQFLADCMDKDMAFANWMERDALFAERVLQDAKELEYSYLVVDGASGIEENFAAVEKVFFKNFGLHNDIEYMKGILIWRDAI